MARQKKTVTSKSPSPAAKGERRTANKRPKASRPKQKQSAKNPKDADRPANLYALLMACDFYLPNRLPEGSYPNLAGCVRDVEHVEEFLRNKLGLTDDNLIKLTSTDTGGPKPKEPPEHWPTYENMVRAFQRLAERASKGDQVYIHYSGHGGRAPTIVPKIKGSQALDEALVPIDIGNKSARYLRDIEIAKLLKDLVDAGPEVTVVFDSCHSGGAARAAMRAETNLAVRGVDFVDKTPRPTDSLVGTVEELAQAWAAPRGQARDAAMTRNLITQAETLGYTYLAACRPGELAYEAVFDGSERNGALTYWLLDALQQLGPELTYRMVYESVLARVHSRFERQTPLLQGNADRVVFGTCSLKPALAAPVMSVTDDGKSLKLLAGQSTLVRPGGRFVIYPNGTLEFTQVEKRLALVRIRDVSATDATAEVVQVFGKAKIKPGDLAVLMGAPSQKLVRKVRVERADGKPPKPEDAALQAVLKALPDNGWIEAASGPSDAADFVVRPSDDQSRYLICDSDAQPLSLRPEIGLRDGDAAKTIVKRLVHLAKYRSVQDLQNNDALSPLKGKIVARLLGVQDDYTEGDKPKPKPIPAGQPATLRPGQWTFLSIENKSGQEVNVAVLDLQPNWGITVVHPQETNLDFTPLSSNLEPLVLPLQANLPEGYESGTDTLKVMVTLEPAFFRSLELPALDQPRPATAKGARRGGGSPLDTLLQAVSADTVGKRSLVPAATASRGWFTSELEIRVIAEPKKQEGRGAIQPGENANSTRAGMLSEEERADAEAFSTFRQRKLSLWQSVVEAAVARRLSGTRSAARGVRTDQLPLADPAVRRSDPARAATALASALDAGQPLADAQPIPGILTVEDQTARGVVGTAWKCNKLALQLAWAKLSGDANAAQQLADELTFGSCDPLWGECVQHYMEYFRLNKGNIPYRSGGDYVLDVNLPQKATVALFADWGTGTQTAIDLLAQIARKKPDMVFHLGDIYYSGTDTEMRSRFLDICRQLLNSTPLFSLSGNHDMYSGGAGYYWLVDQLGQQASYFCVRNANWQFLAMDTGYNDFDPFTVSSNVTRLTNEEALWQQTKIREGRDKKLRTILLSHHPLFSAFDPIGQEAVNNLLLSQFQDCLPDVEAWFWGHEHRLSIFAPYSGLRRGRCIGCAAIPVFVEANSSMPKYPVPLLPDPNNSGQPITLGNNGMVYNHAYAIVELNGPTARVTYYQDVDEQNPLFVETLGQ
jgi:hypothetical protein